MAGWADEGGWWDVQLPRAAVPGYRYTNKGGANLYGSLVMMHCKCGVLKRPAEAEGRMCRVGR